MKKVALFLLWNLLFYLAWSTLFLAHLRIPGVYGLF